MRSRRLMYSAVSKPSRSGIWTSSRMTAKSSCSSRRSASSPEVTVTQRQASGASTASSASRFSRPVVDQQDGRRGGLRARGHGGHRASSCSSGADAVQRDDGVGARGGERRRRHLAGARRRRGPARSRRPPRRASARSPSAPSALAPVRTTPIAAGPYASAADSKSTSIDGRRELHGRLGRQRDVAVLDQQVVAARADQHAAGRERRLVLGLRTTSGLLARRAARTAGSSPSLLRCCTTASGSSKPAGSPPSRRPSGVQPAPGRPDHHDTALWMTHGHGRRRYSFSAASSTS